MNKVQAKQHDVSLDMVRIFGVALVIAGHSHFPWPLEKAIYSFHMPLFFFLSGMLFRNSPPVTLARKKFKTLIIPYVMASLLTACLYGVASGAVLTPDFYLSIPPGIFRAQSPDGLFWNSPLWFLPALFWCFMAMALLSRFVGDRLGPLLAVPAGILLVGWAATHREYLPLGLDTASEGLIFVSLGFLFTQVLAKIRLNSIRLGLLAAASFFVWLILFAIHPDYFVVAHLKVFPLWLWLALSLSGTVAVVAFFTFACDVLPERVVSSSRQSLVKVAAYTFPLYMFHKPIITLLAEWLGRAGYDPQSSYPFLFLCGTAITLAGVLLFEFCTPRFYALVVGGRSTGIRRSSR